MPKRRRERDKPKSGPESLYNPNKRVLLSYASDEEETSATDNAAEPLPVDPAEAAIDDRTLANYQMDEYPDSENDAAPGAPVDESVDAYAREDGYGYARENIDDVEYQVTSTTWNNRGARDWDGPTLKPMLGPVSHGEGQDDEEEYDPDTEEAMAYLRAVRYERQTIPEILSAQRQIEPAADHPQDHNHNKPNDTKLQGNEGETVPVETVGSTPADDDATNPQKVFTRLLVERFLDQRKQLHMPPSMGKLTELPDSCPISFPRHNNKASAEWCQLLSTKAPLPAQLRSMDQDTIFNLLELVQRHYLSKNCNLNKITSAWIWSLLARVDDIGTMTNDDMFPLRDFGKRAVFILLSFTNPELAAGLEILEQEIEQEDDPQTEEEAPSVAAVDADKAPSVGGVSSASTTPPTENTLATLDMVLVVIGEAFRQQDLLEFRPVWPATAGPV